jgi:hypothetical protein
MVDNFVLHLLLAIHNGEIALDYRADDVLVATSGGRSDGYAKPPSTAVTGSMTVHGSNVTAGTFVVVLTKSTKER